MHKNDFTLPVSFTGSFTPRMSQILLQNNESNFTEKGRCLQDCEFQGLLIFSRPNKDIKYFLRT